MPYKLIKQPGKLILRCNQPMILIGILVLPVSLYFLTTGTFSPRVAFSIFLTGVFWIVCLLCFQDACYEFDLINRRMIYKCFGPMCRVRKGSVSFDEISAIEVTDSLTDREQRTTRIVITTGSTHMPLSSTFDNPQTVESCFIAIHEAVKGKTPSLTRATPEPKVKALNSVKKTVSISSETEAIVDSLIAQKKFIDAIKLVRHEASVDLKAAKDYVDQRAKHK